MKICYISNLYPPAVLGGAEIIVQKTAQAMHDKGHDIFIITTSMDSEEHITYDGDLRVYQINTTRLYQPYDQTSVSGIKKPLWHLFDLKNSKTQKRIEEILEEEKPDIIHINNYKGLSLNVFKVGKKLDIPIVFESHDFSLICPRANLIRGNNTLCLKPNIVCRSYINIQRRLLSDNVDLMIAPSNFMIEKYQENDFFNETMTAKIPLAIDKETTRKPKEYDTINIVYIGSLGKHKGVHTLIDAFKLINNPSIHLHIIGKGYDEEEFKLKAKDDIRIIFHGFVDNSKIDKYYEMANIIVVPSICYDNSPMVIYESFSHATPVVGSNIGGIPELVNDGVNGLLFKPEDPEDLKDKLEELIYDKEKLASFEDEAAHTLPADSMKVMIKSLEDKYLKLIN